MSRFAAPSLHLITSRRRLAPEARTAADELLALEAFLDEAIDASPDVIQVREADLEAGVLAGLVARVVARAAGTPVRVLVNERADVAAASGADGVHLPSRGMSAARVRALRPGWVIGRSMHAGDTDDDGADYVMFGTVFPSESKREGSAVAGLDGLRAAVTSARRPVVAIGGITPERSADCVAAGAAGIAAIGVFLPPRRARGALGPAAAVAAFRGALGEVP